MLLTNPPGIGGVNLGTAPFEAAAPLSIIRDIKLSITHSCGGLFLKTQVFSTYLWCVNQKPFGTGTFLTQKRNFLNVFTSTNGIDSPPGLPQVRRSHSARPGHVVRDGRGKTTRVRRSG